MKLIGVAALVASMCTVAGAQTQTTHERAKNKVEVKDGKKITVNGCLERASDGGYLITSDEGRMKYALVTDKDLSKDLGHRVEVRGKATDRGDAKVKIESKVGTSGAASTTTTTDDTKAELKGDLGLKYLGVDSVKSLSNSCR